MLTKEKFKEYTDILERMHEKHVKKDEAIAVLYPMANVWHDVSEEIELIMRLLGDLMECNWDGNDTYFNDIEWFWYESYTNGKQPIAATLNGVEYKISDFGELYDFIVEMSKCA